MKRKTSRRIKWQACSSTASGCSWILAELIPVQLEDSKCRLCGWRSAHCREKAPPSCKGRPPGFPGDPCPTGMRSKPVAGGGERDKRQAPAEVPWQWHRLQSGKEGAVKATEPSASLPHVLPAGSGKACQVCREKQPCGWSCSKDTCPTRRARSEKDASIAQSEQECLSLLSVSLFGGPRE